MNRDITERESGELSSVSPGTGLTRRVPGSPRAARVRLAVVSTAAAAALLPLPADWVERWYSRGFYPPLQAALTPVTNLIPIALLDAAILVLLVAVVGRFGIRVRARGWISALGSGVVGLVVLAAVTYLAFLLLWGLNYRRAPLERALDYDEARVTREAAGRLANDAVEMINATHAGAHARSFDSPSFEEAFATTLRLLGRERPAVPGAPKRSLLELYFRSAAIDGMTDPFFLEVILNPDVLPFERPLVLAHEWAHLAGYANEAEANFVAWLTCVRGDALPRYSAWLSAYRHAMAALPREDARQVAARLEEGPRRDLAAMAERYRSSSPAVRHVSREVYDSYLRANRVDKGIASYDDVLRLLLGSAFDPDFHPRLR